MIQLPVSRLRSHVARNERDLTNIPSRMHPIGRSSRPMTTAIENLHRDRLTSVAITSNIQQSPCIVFLDLMCPRRGYVDTSSNAASKRQERDARQQEKKAREKKTYLKKDENAGAFNAQLRSFNLQLRDIVGDGNCLFRSCEFDGASASPADPRASSA